MEWNTSVLQKNNRQTCATKKHKTNPITTGRSEDTAVQLVLKETIHNLFQSAIYLDIMPVHLTFLVSSQMIIINWI